MRVNIDLEDTLTLLTTGISGPDIQQVGADPAWEDDSDATYVDVVGKFFGPSEPRYFSTARADLEAQTFTGQGIDGNEPSLQLRLDVRLRGLQADLPFPRVQLIASDSSIIYPTNAPANAPNATETVSLIMDRFSTVWTSPHQWRIEIGPTTPDPVPGSAPGTSPGRVTRNWYIYEVRPHWLVPAFEAPPCRLFPRGDGLGVGSGRHFPTSKSQQRSGRRFGYY